MSSQQYRTEKWAGSSNKLSNFERQTIAAAQQHNAREQVVCRI